METINELPQAMLSLLGPYVPFGALSFVVIIFLAGLSKYLNKQAKEQTGFAFRKQLIFSGAVILGIIVLLIAIPIDDGLRGQLFSLLGIMVSAIIALSSTTIVGNIMAGLMLRTIHSFNIGDFVKIADHFGRVSEIDLLHVEIQTEDRDLKTLPNLFLIHQPFTVIHSTGTIISAEVSLGYDTDRKLLEKYLLEAAEQAGLSDPFVQVMALGDFSVNYRVGGMLNEVKHLISSRSKLRCMVMDHLHGNGIEIASPNLMNQRPFASEKLFIPPQSALLDENKEAPSIVEDIVFDKAERATKIDRLRQRLDSNIKKLGELEANVKDTSDKEEKAIFKEKAALYQHQNDRLKQWLKDA